jgi:hypothetical protein
MPNLSHHDDTLTLRNFTVDRKIFAQSIHGKLTCQQCHADIHEYPHVATKPRVKVGCGDNCHATDSAGNKVSHAAIVATYDSSIHRRGLQQAHTDMPACTACHGAGNPHAIAKANHALSAQDKIQLCTSCHGNEEIMTRNGGTTEPVKSYRHSFHYKAINFGVTNTATCQDCHTAHHVLPKDNPASSIAPQNIVQTCGQASCHEGAQINFALSGAGHLSSHIEKNPILWFEEKFFIILTLGTMLALCFYILLDIQKRFGWLELAVHFLSKFIRFASKVLHSVGRFLKQVLIG